MLHVATHAACYHSHANEEVIQLLVAKGADLTLQDLYGNKPMDYLAIAIPLTMAYDDLKKRSEPSQDEETKIKPFCSYK